MIKKMIFALIAGIFLVSCASNKVQHKNHDDVIRIKEEFRELYSVVPTIDKRRNSAALRGKAYKIQTYIEECNDSIISMSKTVLVFRDSLSGSPLEYIPIERIQFMGPSLGQNYGINWVEQYNQPLNNSSIREIPIDTTYISVCEKDTVCDCQPLNANIELTCPCSEGREKNLGRFFLEAKLGYGLYKDNPPGIGPNVGRDEYFGDIAAGIRFGSRRQWNVGLLYSTGVPMYNSRELPVLEDGVLPDGIRRPLGLIYGKYSFEEKSCIRPFVYGEFGLSLDEFSMQLTNLNLCPDCEDCRARYDRIDADINTDLPLSYGFGVGVDVPLSCSFDLSLDMGYRSVAFGEESAFTIFGFRPINNRRLDMFMFRVGVTL